MSKTHIADGTSDIDSELDAYINTQKAKPVVASTDNGIDLFGSPEVKKKTWLRRLLAFLNPFQPAHIQ